jgi:hypothetical protein
MILRRIAQQALNQEWSVIAIELMIVIAGVYLGIQAQDWSTNRENREIERQHLSSLHDEISEMIEIDTRRVAAARDQLQAIESVARYFSGASTGMELTTDHCEAISRSHIYVGGILTPPTIEELLATGRLQLITNSALRSAIVSYSQKIEGYRQLNTDIQVDRLVLSRVYPSLITLKLQSQEDPTCDFAAMRQSPSFLNDLADNSYRHEAFVNQVVVGQQELRTSLHAVLDPELGIYHPIDVQN